MRVLVTGAAGFAGQHACRELAEHGHTVVGADLATPAAHQSDVTEWMQLDICDAAACRRVLEQSVPDACLHVAGMAFVPGADSSSGAVFKVNTLGTLHLLDAALAVVPDMRMLVVTTSEVYGAKEADGDGSPISEEAPLAPRHLYGISKAAADQCALLYARTHNLDVMTARPSNHTGPGQRPPFVVPAFIERMLALRGRGRGTIRVGNLACQRRFLDVRDVARAYRLILESGRQGEAYNISTDQSMRIGVVLELLASKLGVQVETEVDPELYRPTDAAVALDMTKIQKDCNWLPQYELSETLDAMLTLLIGH